jgi:hypothetical protein
LIAGVRVRFVFCEPAKPRPRASVDPRWRLGRNTGMNKTNVEKTHPASESGGHPLVWVAAGAALFGAMYLGSRDDTPGFLKVTDVNNPFEEVVD